VARVRRTRCACPAWRAGGDLGTHAAALARQRQDTPFFPESHLVRTADPGDRVLTNPEHPGEVSAVHGPLSGDADCRGRHAGRARAAGWVYRVRRAALEVAGATILPQPGLPPDCRWQLRDHISDDDSPWASGLRCDRLKAVADQADQKARFAADSQSFRTAARAAQEALVAAGCDAQ